MSGGRMKPLDTVTIGEYEYRSYSIYQTYLIYNVRIDRMIL